MGRKTWGYLLKLRCHTTSPQKLLLPRHIPSRDTPYIMRSNEVFLTFSQPTILVANGHDLGFRGLSLKRASSCYIFCDNKPCCPTDLGTTLLHGCGKSTPDTFYGGWRHFAPCRVSTSSYLPENRSASGILLQYEIQTRSGRPSCTTEL